MSKGIASFCTYVALSNAIYRNPEIRRRRHNHSMRQTSLEPGLLTSARFRLPLLLSPRCVARLLVPFSRSQADHSLVTLTHALTRMNEKTPRPSQPASSPASYPSCFLCAAPYLLLSGLDELVVGDGGDLGLGGGAQLGGGAGALGLGGRAGRLRRQL